MTVLGALVEGFVAWGRDAADVQVIDLELSKLALFPGNKLLPDMMVAADWSAHEPKVVRSELILSTGRGLVALREDVSKLRPGLEPGLS